MERIKLMTATGGLVGYATIPPFNKPAEAVLWGQRTFFFDNASMTNACRADANADPNKMLVYREGMMVAAMDYSSEPVVKSPLFESMENPMGLIPISPEQIAWKPVLGTGGGTTTDRDDPGLKVIQPNGQQEKYLVLSSAERAKGFVRPYRDQYTHVARGVLTKMGHALSETYARNNKFYGGTFCCGCQKHFPLVNADGTSAFLWDDGTGVGT